MKKTIVSMGLLLSLIGCGEFNKEIIGHVTPFGNKFFVTEFNEVKECSGIEAPIPNVAVIEQDSWPWESNTGYYDGFSLIVFVQANNRGAVKHEFIHYLLHIEGGLDRNHVSFLFEKCAT